MKGKFVLDKGRRVCYNCTHFEKSLVRSSDKKNKSMGCLWLELATTRIGWCRAVPKWALVKYPKHYCDQFRNRHTSDWKVSGYNSIEPYFGNNDNISITLNTKYNDITSIEEKRDDETLTEFLHRLWDIPKGGKKK